MSKSAKQEEIAKRFLDLWQDEMSALLGDQDSQKIMQDFMTFQMSNMSMLQKIFSQTLTPQGFAKFTGATFDDENDTPSEVKPKPSSPRKDETSGSGVPTSKAGATPVVSSSEHSREHMVKLTDRLAALEARLAHLESTHTPADERSAHGNEYKPARGEPARRTRRKTSRSDRDQNS